MPDELEQEIKGLNERLRDRDEAERKKAEREFRAAMRKDTAGTVLSMFQYVHACLLDLQNQLDAANPLAAMVRRIEARLMALEAALVEGRKARGEE